MKNLPISRSAGPNIALGKTNSSESCLAGFESITDPAGAAHAEIRHRAFSIWECAGRPSDCELQHWLEAEAEVMAGH